MFSFHVNKYPCISLTICCKHILKRADWTLCAYLLVRARGLAIVMASRLLEGYKTEDYAFIIHSLQSYVSNNAT